jgi:two-component system chemotaxis sensor kinase CheA
VANRKSAVGRLRLSAQRASGCIVVSLADDGRGIDLDGVRRSAVERGIATREHLARMSDRQLVDLIFAPGLSTVDTVTQLSGRGVGLDVVRSNLERMHGSVEIVTHKGSGTQFTLRVPEHAGSSRDTTIIPPAKAA